jgi:ferrochelatase
MKKNAVLLINLGTPDDCNPKAVRRYLREFLNDPRVIDLPGIIRWTLVNVLIVPFRHKKTTTAYKKIWLDTGSPLLTFSQQMRKGLADRLGSDYHVELGMRYGNPSIEHAFEKIRDYESITVIPLFPQYSSAANGSATEKLLSYAAREWNIPDLRIISDFYNHAGFIRSVAETARKTINDTKDKFILFSYHGLPERHISKSGCRIQCNKLDTCPNVDYRNRFCYRAQCYATTRLVAAELGLDKDQYTVAFQSRLGRTPWIRPYTDLILPELIHKGIRDIAIISPSFVADCLETLEEIDIRTREQWLALGGTGFTYVPCLNNSETWISALEDMVRNNR